MKIISLSFSKFIALLLVLSVLPEVSLAFGFGNSSGSPVNENPLTAEASFQPGKIGVGGTADLVINMQLVSPYRAYLEAFKVVIEYPPGIKNDEPRISPIITFQDSISKSVKEGIEKSGQLKTLVELPSDFPIGDHKATVKLTYQACTDEHCLFPKTIKLEAPFKAVSAAEATPRLGSNDDKNASAAATDSAPMSEFQKALGQSMFSAILLMLAAGFLTSLTPCVYPMIPITLAVLGARAKGQSHWRSFSLSVVYVLGIAVTYSVLGVLAASTGALFGSFLGNVWVVTAIALIFIAMALSMYGLYDLQAPAFIRQKLGGSSIPQGYPGAFLTGTVAGVVASPCVGPVLVGVLTYIAKTQDKTLGFTMLFSFALGMGALFIVLGLSSSVLTRLPKAGPWMESIKFIFGTVMVGMALYYIEPVYPRWLFLALAGLALVLISSNFGAFESNPKLSAWGRVRKGLLLAVLFIGAALMATGVLEKTGVLNSASSTALKTSESYPKLNWQPYSENALESAKASGRPVIIDFYADWCVACIELEKYTFVDPRIRDLSQKFLLLKIDATNDFPGLDELKSRYQVMGLPTMIFYDSKGKMRSDLTLTGFEKAEPFLERMKSAQ